MIYIIYGGDNKTALDEVNQLKLNYDKSIIFTEYNNLVDVFEVVSGKSLFDPGNRLIIFYNLDTKYIWIKDIIDYINVDVVMVFPSIDKRSLSWKALEKSNKCLFIKLETEDVSVFSFIDKIAEGDIKFIFENYDSFINESRSIEKLLFLLFRHYYILLRVAELSEKKYTDNDICSKLNINKYFFGKYKKQASTIKIVNIINCLGFIKYMKLMSAQKYQGDRPIINERTLINSILFWFYSLSKGVISNYRSL